MTTAPIPRRAEPDVRRQSLIAACARVLAREGAAGTSVRVIAREAGVSPGLITHYFTGIEALIAATYADVDQTVRAAMEVAVAAAGTDPRARLDAFVTASFAPPIADRALLATWIAFWSLVSARADIARQHDDQYAAYRARLTEMLDACGVAPDRLRLASITLAAVVDGLWLELCLSPGCFSAQEAGVIARAQIDSLMPPPK
ncbi:TetR family transcriptional regulator C-terminal domain-containing protein [Novosphingobium sp. FSW06-99]|uniref:TetR family transcriptional regulator C-terminal domain-containing protein n=1 Tax=Novosphingobium sp. FSW06-99 TaxID=1739113 RepID=UPI00076C9D83|nr:TetR family transcriptional regulator C-terminal domain-containing protein [Novosphingobium sp. FSW06-99]KUR74343.1 TetR family transcriptional regulator [Novosphingobium sp. FSW06-99]